MTLGVGVIGLGFMGATHIRAYAAAARAGFSNQLVAVADPGPDRLTGRAMAAGNIDTGADERLFDPAHVRTTTDPIDVFTDPRVELVSICAHTDAHVDLAVSALERGKHVMVEKPVAITRAGVQRVIDAVRASGRVCMPGMCIRFWPGWDWLRDRVRDGSLGPVRSAVFRRLGSMPTWSSFYADESRSGGALFDLHIHDSDFVRHLFGPPDAVTSAGSRSHITTLYHYEGGPRHVVAEGGWDLAPGFGFRMQYTVVFERATADFDIGRTPRLILSRDGKTEPVPIDTTLTGYDLELRALIAAINKGPGRWASPVPLADAMAVTDLLHHELESIERGEPVSVRPISA